jgi:hypothetical protein
MVGSTLLFKQTTGMFISAIFIMYKLLLAANKSEFKIVIKIVFTRFLGVLIPITLLVLYLSINNIWNEFLDYTIYGIKTFSNYVSYLYLIKSKNIIIKVLSILVPCSFLYMYYATVIRKQNKIERKNLFIFFVYGVGCFIVVFPISDTIHFLIGSLPAMIAVIYILWKITQKIYRKIPIKGIKLYMREFIKVFVVLSIGVILVNSIYVITKCIIEVKRYDKINHFKYIELSEKTITLIGDYILQKESEGKKVYILDAVAAIYMIPIDRYNKNYDMFLLGNLGSKGEQGQIENLEEQDNIMVLILNDNYNRNWQNPEKVRAYIIENWNKKGQIEIFDIYEKI